MKIELTGEQIDEVVREDLVDTLQILIECGEDHTMVEAVTKVISYYSVPSRESE